MGLGAGALGSGRWEPRSREPGRRQMESKKIISAGKKCILKKEICDMRRRCVVWCACGEKGRAALAGFCVARMELWEMVAEPK